MARAGKNGGCFRSYGFFSFHPAGLDGYSSRSGRKREAIISFSLADLSGRVSILFHGLASAGKGIEGAHKSVVDLCGHYKGEEGLRAGNAFVTVAENREGLGRSGRGPLLTFNPQVGTFF